MWASTKSPDAAATDADNTGLITGIIVAVVIALLTIIVIIGLIFYWR